MATTTSAVRPSASRATVWPAIVSSIRAGRRGIRRSRTTSQPASSSRPSTPRTTGEGWYRPRSAGRGRGSPSGKRPELGGDEEQQAGVAPEEKAAAQAAHGRTETNAPPPATGEEIDRADHERQERGQEHELDRPAPHESRSEVDVARRSLRELEAGVERADEVLGRAAELAQARGAERVVLEDLRRNVRNGGERQCRDAAGDERPLLSEGERKAEVEQLADAGRTLRLATGLLEHANRGRAHERGGR